MPVQHPANQDEYNKLKQKRGLLVVDFSASWCGPCQSIAPFFVELSDQFSEVTFIKIDINQLEGLDDAQDCRSIPTFKFFKDGTLVRTFSGADRQKLKASVEELRGTDDLLTTQVNTRNPKTSLTNASGRGAYTAGRPLLAAVSRMSCVCFSSVGEKENDRIGYGIVGTPSTVELTRCVEMFYHERDRWRKEKGEDKLYSVLCNSGLNGWAISLISVCHCLKKEGIGKIIVWCPRNTYDCNISFIRVVLSSFCEIYVKLYSDLSEVCDMEKNCAKKEHVDGNDGYVVLIESPVSQFFTIVDIRQIWEVKRALGKCYVISDDSWTVGPLLHRQSPFLYGIDVSFLSLTKHVTGAGDALCGFCTTKNKKIGELMERVRLELGVVVAADTAYLVMKGLISVRLRLERQHQNVRKFYQYLETEGFNYVEQIYIGGWKKPRLFNELYRGQNGLLSIILRKDLFETDLLVEMFVDELIKHGNVHLAAGWGAWSHLVCVRTRKKLEDIGDGIWAPNYENIRRFIRFSIGIDDVGPLIRDFENTCMYIEKLHHGRSTDIVKQTTH